MDIILTILSFFIIFYLVRYLLIYFAPNIKAFFLRKLFQRYSSNFYGDIHKGTSKRERQKEPFSSNSDNGREREGDTVDVIRNASLDAKDAKYVDYEELPK